MSREIKIVGDGQLGRMLALAAQDLGVRPVIQSKSENSPAAQVADAVISDYYDARAVAQLFIPDDVGTYEFENVSVEGLLQAQAQGSSIFPDPSRLGMLTDKFLQKSWLQVEGFPVGPFSSVDSALSIRTFAESMYYPVMLKKRRGSYDGTGNWLIRNPFEIDEAFARMSEESRLYVEANVAFAHELAVVLCRDISGNVVTYPAVWTTQINGICSVVTARREGIPGGSEAEKIATAIAERLDYVGVLAVEFFQLPNGQLFVNELAPRVHNSGHWTIEGSETSQFENHIRAVMGMELGSTQMKYQHVAMVNVLGTRDLDIPGEPIGSARASSQPRAFFHWYGKPDSRLGRKLGHVTAVSDDSNHETTREVIARAQRVVNYLQV